MPSYSKEADLAHDYEPTAKAPMTTALPVAVPVKRLNYPRVFFWVAFLKALSPVLAR